MYRVGTVRIGYVISEFADSVGKKSGEFCTPRGTVQLVVVIDDVSPVDTPIAAA